MLARSCVAWMLLCACSCGDGAAPAADGRSSDGDAGATDLGVERRDGEPDAASGPHWSEAHCKSRTCYFVMQGVAGADDTACNGRHPTDLGTSDSAGKGDCPFVSLDAVRPMLSPPGASTARGVTVFVGAGTYAVYPFGVQIRAGGKSAAEAVVLTAYRGEKPVIDGSCPKMCVVDTPAGPVEREPCCQRACPSCSVSPLCVPAKGGQSQCAVPIDHVERLVTVEGDWLRVEGLDLRGCWEDNIRVAWRASGTPPTIVPNHHIYITNNRIEGCDVNENIKGLRNGPGPAHGGPAWGPIHIVGNELYAMASQAVDATGVHNWTVEDNHAHDAKVGKNVFADFDGGGIGFKNGGSDVRVRNNWTERSDGYGGGGSSGSCISDTTAPSDWGCFQKYEMIDVLFENNVALEASLRAALNVYQCDDCRFFGNTVVGGEVGSLLMIGDRCPGPQCEPHNPGLLPSRGLRFERNYMSGGRKNALGGPVMILYYRDTHTAGPAANGMVSRDNIFCAAGFAVTSDPDSEQKIFGHRDPGQALALSDYRAHIGDSGSAVFNAVSAPKKPCPAAGACRIGVDAAGARWGVPGCSGCSCTLVVDGSEQSVSCDNGQMAIDAAPGRHYVALRVARAGGGRSCGASYQIASPVVGASCSIDASDANTLRWSSSGVRCRLIIDGGVDLGVVPCDGSDGTPTQLLALGRHRVLLRVEDAPSGQTSCSAMLSP